MEVFKKPNDPTVYEYNPDTGDYYPIASPEDFLARGYQWDQVQTWDDNKLEDVIALDAAINDQTQSETDFETYYQRFSEADAKSAKQLAKEYLATNEKRINEDYKTDRAQLSQSWQRAQEDYRYGQQQADVQEKRTVRDRLQALEEVQKAKGRTLRAFYDDIGERGISRSGVRGQQEGEIKTDYAAQARNIKQNAGDTLENLDAQRRQAATQYARYGEDIKADNTALDLNKNRAIEDIQTARADFKQQRIDESKANRRDSFIGTRNYLRGN